jgi:hypothetical protein
LLGLRQNHFSGSRLPRVAKGRGKHVWIAVGDYLGKEIRAQAESEAAAVKRRRETASTMVTSERTGHE